MISLEDNFNLISLCVFSTLMTLSVVLKSIVCGCCKKKKKQQESNPFDAIALDGLPSAEEKKSTGRTIVNVADEKKCATAKKAVISYAKTSDYDTMLNMDKLNPTVIAGGEKKPAGAAPGTNAPETMGYNIITPTIIQKVANLEATKKVAEPMKLSEHRKTSEPKEPKRDELYNELPEPQEGDHNYDKYHTPPKSPRNVHAAGETIMSVVPAKYSSPKHVVPVFAPQAETLGMGYRIVPQEKAEHISQMAKKGPVRPVYSPYKTPHRPGVPVVGKLPDKDYVDKRDYGTFAAVQGDVMHASEKDRQNEIKDQTTTAELRHRIERDMQRLKEKMKEKEKEKEKKGGHEAKERSKEKHEKCESPRHTKERDKHHQRSGGHGSKSKEDDKHHRKKSKSKSKSKEEDKRRHKKR